MTYCSKVAEAVVGLGVMSGKTNSQAVCPIQMNKFQSRLQDVVERQCKEDYLPQPHDVFDKYQIYQWKSNILQHRGETQIKEIFITYKKQSILNSFC